MMFVLKTDLHFQNGSLFPHNEAEATENKGGVYFASKMAATKGLAKRK